MEALERHRDFIRKNGTIDGPIIATETPDGLIIQNGHHRWLAAKQFGLERVPVKVIRV